VASLTTWHLHYCHALYHPEAFSFAIGGTLQAYFSANLGWLLPRTGTFHRAAREIPTWVQTAANRCETLQKPPLFFLCFFRRPVRN
jgi:hypothetical protein